MDDFERPEGNAPESNEMPPQNANQQQQYYSFNQPQNQYQQQTGSYQQPGNYQQPPQSAQPAQSYYTQQPNPQYPYTQNYQTQYYPARGKATGSLVLGIVSLVFFWMSFLSIISIICGVIGVVLGSSARKELPPGPGTGSGSATAGLVCSIIGLILGLVILIVTITAVNRFSWLFW